jgi:hypothetical protein
MNDEDKKKVIDAATVLIDLFDDYYDQNIGHAMYDTREKMIRNGHKYKTDGREMFRAGLKSILQFLK